METQNSLRKLLSVRRQELLPSQFHLTSLRRALRMLVRLGMDRVHGGQAVVTCHKCVPTQLLLSDSHMDKWSERHLHCTEFHYL